MKKLGLALLLLPCIASFVAAASWDSGSADSARSQLQQLSGSSIDSRAQERPALPFEAASGAQAPAAKAAGIGLSHSGDPFDIPGFSLGQIAQLLRQAGGTHYRPHLPLNEPYPKLSQADLARLDQAAKDPAILDSMIDDLSRNGHWERIDSLVGAFAGQGIRLMLVVGAGYVKEAPDFLGADGKVRPVSPDRIGRGRYLTMVRWLVGAGVRRYAPRVQYWQVENEINLAHMVAEIGWRVKEKSWKSVAFRKQLISTLADTVHSEGRRQGLRLLTAHNFTAGIPGFLAAPIGPVEGGAVDLSGAIRTFGAAQDLDIVGIDLYDNHFVGWPILDAAMTNDVRTAVSLAGGRPVWVLETGYATAPWERGYSPEHQAEYFSRIFDNFYGAGAQVVLAFGWFWNPLGWYTDSKTPLPWYDVSAPEQYWSPISVVQGPDGKRQTKFDGAWDAFEAAARKWIGQSPAPVLSTIR